MEILFASSHEDRSRDWIQAFRQALPDATFRVLGDGEPEGRADMAIVWAPPEDLCRREPRLRYIFNLGAGVDALLGLRDLPDAVRLVRLEDGGMSVQMAEYVLYFLLRESRDFGRYAQLQPDGRWDRQPNIERADWPVGIMGAGVMGGRVARAVAAFEYPVAVWSRRATPVEGAQAFGGATGFADFLKRTRVLVNVLPLTARTEGILCRETFCQLRPDAYVINIGRGGHLVEKDLLDCLNDGHLRGAALDVFSEEPLPPAHPFWADHRIQVTPHIAGASMLADTVAQIAGKIQAVGRGESISGVVDPVLRY